MNVAESPETLFRDWFLSIGGQLIAPLFDGGQRRAEVDRTAAVLFLRFNEYGQTMLNAFREVEDNLALERNQLERIERLEEQVRLARRAYEQLRDQYLIGDSDFLSVLTANTAQQRLQRETLSARLELIQIRIALYLALAGDFEPRPEGLPVGIPVPEAIPTPEREAAPDGLPEIDDSDPPVDVDVPEGFSASETPLDVVGRSVVEEVLEEIVIDE